MCLVREPQSPIWHIQTLKRKPIPSPRGPLRPSFNLLWFPGESEQSSRLKGQAAAEAPGQREGRGRICWTSTEEIYFEGRKWKIIRKWPDIFCSCAVTVSHKDRQRTFSGPVTRIHQCPWQPSVLSSSQTGHYLSPLHDVHFGGITIQVAAQLVPYKESFHKMLFFIFCLSARPAYDLLAVAKHKAIIFFYWTHSG